MKPADQQRIDELLDWGKKYGAVLHPSVDVFDDPTTKFSLRAQHGLSGQPGITAVTCPHSMTLSYLSCLVDGRFLTKPTSGAGSARTAFPPNFMAGCPPHVIGRFYLIQQYLLGKKSFWWAYIQTLPQPDKIASWALPAFWPEDEAALLEGTNAGVAIEEIQANVKTEHKQARKLLKEANFPGWQDYTRILYNWAFCIFTSRSFRPSLILDEQSKHEAAKILPEGCKLDDFSILMPVFDIANHSPTASIRWDTEARAEHCQLICNDSYEPGEQVFNNYGMKTNSELLLGYGFILPENEAFHNDYVHVRMRAPSTNVSTSDEATEAQEPKDYLVSLRPKNDPSSLVTRSRRGRELPTPFKDHPAFAYVEDALVWGLLASLTTEEERASLEKGAGLSEIDNIISQIRSIIGGKLADDLETIQALNTDSITDQDLESPNEKLAFVYRQRCEKVLVAALEALQLDANSSS